MENLADSLKFLVKCAPENFFRKNKKINYFVRPLFFMVFFVLPAVGIVLHKFFLFLAIELFFILIFWIGYILLFRNENKRFYQENQGRMRLLRLHFGIKLISMIQVLKKSKKLNASFVNATLKDCDTFFKTQKKPIVDTHSTTLLLSIMVVCSAALLQHNINYKNLAIVLYIFLIIKFTTSLYMRDSKYKQVETIQAMFTHIKDLNNY